VQPVPCCVYVDFTALLLFISHTLEMLLLIKICGTHHASVRQIFALVFGIWYLKYQILSKQQIFEKVFEVVFKYQNEHQYLVFYLNTHFVTTLAL